MKWLDHILGLILFSNVLIATTNAQSLQIKLGPVLWEMDSVGHFVVPTDADIVVVARLAPHAPDTNLLVLDARTGAVRRKLRGPFLAGYSVNRQSFDVSNDGHLCIVGDAVKSDGSSETTRAYDLTDGRLLWERKEFAGVFAVSSRLQRTMLGVLMYSGSPPTTQSQMELVDTRDGRTIREFRDDWIGETCFDEDQGRVYIPFKRWQGQEGSWVVEFDATNGEELRKWRTFQGPMAKMPQRDSLYTLSGGSQNNNTFQVSRLDLNSGVETIISKCVLTEPGSCFAGSSPAFRVSGNGHDIFTINTHEDYGIHVVEIDALTGLVKTLINDPTMWENKITRYPRYALSPTNGLFYFVPAGPDFDRRPFVCLSMVPTTSTVDSSDANTKECSVVVVDNGLLISVTKHLSDIQSVEIVNIAGQVVYTRRMSETEAPFEIGLSELPSGRYLCRLVLASQCITKPFSYIK